MVFGHNFIRFSRVSSDFQIDFNANSALATWAENAANQTVDVAYSETWSKERSDVVRIISCRNEFITNGHNYTFYYYY